MPWVSQEPYHVYNAIAQPMSEHAMSHADALQRQHCWPAKVTLLAMAALKQPTSWS